MSTALLYCGKPDGFVIGSDSLGTDKSTNRVKNNKEIKIHAFENPSVSVVFAWAGIVEVSISDSVFSLVQESKDILREVNFQMFAQDFNARLQGRLSGWKVRTTGKCADGMFLYFWNGVPMGFEISVFKNGSSWDSLVSSSGLPDGKIVIVSGGSERTEFDKPRSLNQAKNMIEHYIRECIENPKDKEIGGDVHIGRFTLDGFSWIVPPK